MPPCPASGEEAGFPRIDEIPPASTPDTPGALVPQRNQFAALYQVHSAHPADEPTRHARVAWVRAGEEAPGSGGGRVPVRAGRRAGGLRSTAAAAAVCVRKMWLLPETRRLLLCVAVLAAVQLVGGAITLLHPGLISAHMHGPASRTPLVVVVSLQIATVTLAIGTVLGFLAPKLLVAQREQLGLRRQGPGSAARQEVSGWAPAASKSAYLEIVKVTRQSQQRLLVFGVVFTVAMTASCAVGDTAVWHSPEYMAFRAATCGDGAAWWSPCMLAWKFRDTLALLTVSSNTYICGMLYSLRTEMFSPLFEQALRQTGTRWLIRCLRLHWVLLPLTPTSLFVFVVNERVKLMKATRPEMTAFTAVSALHVAVCWLFLAWSLDLDGALFARLARLWRKDLPERSAWRSVRRALPTDYLYEQSPPQTQFGEEASVSNRGVWASVRDPGGGFKHRQLQLLVNLILLMLVQPFGSPWSMGVVWAVRLVAILLLLSADDPPCRFTDLSAADASFGLLVDASQLSDALRAYLKGQVYRGPLVMTKASYYRMDDTLAVSYRWQEDETLVCPGLRLNMSRWQLEALHRGVADAGCLYVWIDRIALPQYSSGLQVALLARMMATYATSRKTLALRALETDGNRYHQRAWTLQEYCNARSLTVVTQPATEASAEMGYLAVTGDEEVFSAEMRAWHKARADLCSPYWLHGGVAGEQAKENIRSGLERFQSLSVRLVCKIPADKIRALYPLLFNIPCDNHVELQQLVRDVASVLGEVNIGSMRRSCSDLAKEMADDESILASALDGDDVTASMTLTKKQAQRLSQLMQKHAATTVGDDSERSSFRQGYHGF
eukprot:jgi/Tetstr1/433762/TSEL_022979.t1